MIRTGIVPLSRSVFASIAAVLLSLTLMACGDASAESRADHPAPSTTAVRSVTTLRSGAGVASVARGKNNGFPLDIRRVRLKVGRDVVVATIKMWGRLPDPADFVSSKCTGVEVHWVSPNITVRSDSATTGDALGRGVRAGSVEVRLVGRHTVRFAVRRGVLGKHFSASAPWEAESRGGNGSDCGPMNIPTSRAPTSGMVHPKV